MNFLSYEEAEKWLLANQYTYVPGSGRQEWTGERWIVAEQWVPPQCTLNESITVIVG